MDLIAREFGVRQLTNDQNRAAAAVHLFGVLVG